ncbi:MAG: DNA-binding domain-containing protein [Pseudomonadota bacterium]
MGDLAPSHAGEAALAAALLAPDLPAPEAVADGRRFAVYRNNVAVGLIDAIAATYPAVLALVGEDFFRAAAREFVFQHPPTSPILIEYGGAFPAWIAAFPPAASVPYLGDVARLEWAWNRAYNAADADPVAPEQVAALAPEVLASSRVTFHPSFALLTSAFPVISLWAQATERVPPSDLDLSVGEEGLIVRPADMVDVRAISPAMAGFLGRLLASETIGEALAPLDGDQELIAECFAGLLQLGLAVDITPTETPTTAD